MLRLQRLQLLLLSLAMVMVGVDIAAAQNTTTSSSPITTASSNNTNTTTTPPSPPPPVTLTIDVKPPEVLDGFTRELTITCTLTINSSATFGNQDLRYLNVLILDHDGDHMATITPFSNGPNVQTTNGSVAGTIEREGRSVLSVTVKHPSPADSGNYSCKAMGLDKDYLPVDMTDADTVSDKQMDNSTLVDQIKSLKSRLDELTDADGGNRWQHVDDDPLFVHIAGMPGGSTRYLLAKGDMGQVHISQFVCFVQGGHLAEINTREEWQHIQYNLIQLKLNGTANLNSSHAVPVWLGTEMKGDNTGGWQHMYHTEDSLYMEQDAMGSPASSGYRCLSLTSRTDFRIEDADCAEVGRPLCEIKGHIV